MYLVLDRHKHIVMTNPQTHMQAMFLQWELWFAATGTLDHVVSFSEFQRVCGTVSSLKLPYPMPQCLPFSVWPS